MVGAGFLAEPGLEEIFGESAKGFRVTLSIDVALEAFNLEGLLSSIGAIGWMRWDD